MSQALFKKLVHWFGLVMLFLAFAALFKAMFLQGMIETSLEAEDGFAKIITILYALAFPVVFCLNFGLFVGRESETRRLTVKQMSQAEFDALAFWLEEIKLDAWRIAIYLAVQFPMLLFCSIFTYSYDYQIIIEAFYAGTAGFYVMTPIALIGWLLSGIYLFSLLLVTRYITLRIWQKEAIVH